MKHDIHQRRKIRFAIPTISVIQVLASASMVTAVEVYDYTLKPGDFQSRSNSSAGRWDHVFYCPNSANVSNSAPDKTWMEITNPNLYAFKTFYDKLSTGDGSLQQLGYYKVIKGYAGANLPVNGASGFPLKIRGVVAKEAQGGGTAEWNINWKDANDTGGSNPDKWMFSFNGIFSCSSEFLPANNNLVEAGSVASATRPFDLEIRIRTKDANPGADGNIAFSPPTGGVGGRSQAWHPKDSDGSPKSFFFGQEVFNMYFDAPSDKAKLFTAVVPEDNNAESLSLNVARMLKIARAQSAFIPNIAGVTDVLYDRRDQCANPNYDMNGFAAGEEIYRGQGELISVEFKCQFND